MENKTPKTKTLRCLCDLAHCCRLLGHHLLPQGPYAFVKDCAGSHSGTDDLWACNKTPDVERTLLSLSLQAQPRAPLPQDLCIPYSPAWEGFHHP